MNRPRALVITGFGINCEEELAAAYRLAGADARIVHLNEILSGAVSIHDYDAVNVPGGFSFGDDLGAGRVLATRIRHACLPHGRTLLEELIRFVEGGKRVLGICNGFQVLVKLGLLPNTTGRYEQEATLADNLSDRYEDRWIRVRVHPTGPVAAMGLDPMFEVPVRHGEGRLVFRDETVRRAVVENGLNWWTYCTAEGVDATGFPENPNGSDLACAALSDPSGRVLGMMPHPEAFLSLYNHFDWPRRRRETPSGDEDGDGLRFFRRLVQSMG